MYVGDGKIGQTGLDEVERLAQICRAHGVRRVKFGDVELELNDAMRPLSPGVIEPEATPHSIQFVSYDEAPAPAGIVEADPDRYGAVAFRPKAQPDAEAGE